MKPVRIKNNKNIFSKRRRRNGIELVAIAALVVLMLTALYIKWNYDNKIVPNAEDNKPKVTEQQPAKAEKEEKEDSVVLPVEIDEDGKVVEEDEGYVPAETETIVTSDGTVVEVVDGPPMHGPENPIIYTVQDGDTLWDIAELIYGDGEMWTELWDMNADALLHYDVRNVSEPGHWIHPDTDIIIPDLSTDH